MTDIVCPLCGKTNPPDLNECQYCQAPLKPGGFIAPAEGESQKTEFPPFSEDTSSPEEPAAESMPASSLEQSIPDWLKETEAGFTEGTKPTSGEPDSDQSSGELEPLVNQPPTASKKPENAIDEDWLASLLVEAGAVETPPSETTGETPEVEEPEPPSEKPDLENKEEGEELALPTPPAEKPDWLTSLEASSKIKVEGAIYASAPEQSQPLPAEVPEEKVPEQVEPPEWLTKAATEAPPESPKEAEAPIAAAELPGWLEALRPSEAVTPTGPVEDVSGADIVTAGPLMGLKGVISPHPSAIRAQKPPTYSIKLKVTEEQQARLRMMEELLADEGKSKPLPSKSIITSRHIFRLVIAIVLLLPMIWMIISSQQKTSVPQPETIPGVVEFTQHIQALSANAPVLIAFDYEAGFSGELNTAITNVITQLIAKQAFITLASTSPSGPALAESVLENAGPTTFASKATYSNYANLGYIPGGTLGLLGFASSPKNILPYSLDGHNVWAGSPLDQILAVKDFSAIIVITGDPDTARIWIEQVGIQLQETGTPLLFITSAQAEPLIRPYFQATPSQVQGLLAGLIGGVAYAQEMGNNQQNGVWDAYSAGITVSILIILVGSIAGVVLKMLPTGKNKEI